MARRLALFFAALFAISQAAPLPQEGNTQQTSTSNGSSSPGRVPSSNIGSSGTNPGASAGTVDFTGPQAIIIPAEYLRNFFSSIPVNRASSSSSSSANDPLTAIISVIPNAINTERDRFSSAVGELVKDNVEAITDTINKAANTGGTVFSNGVKLIGSWPTFFGRLVG